MKFLSWNAGGVRGSGLGQAKADWLLSYLHSMSDIAVLSIQETHCISDDQLALSIHEMKNRFKIIHSPVRRSENSQSHYFKFYRADYDRTLLWALLGGLIDLPGHSFGCRNFIWTWEVKMSDFQHFCKIEQIGIFGWGYLWKQTLLRGLSPLI